MDYTNNSAARITSITEKFSGLEKDHNSTSTQQIELSLESLKSNFSMITIDNGSVLHKMEGINSTFKDVKEIYVDTNLTQLRDDSFSYDDNTTNSTTSMCDDNDVQGWDIVFEFVFHGVLLNCVGMLGLVGNLLSIFILSRPQMKGSTNCILIGLATYDSILIITR